MTDKGYQRLQAALYGVMLMPWSAFAETEQARKTADQLIKPAASGTNLVQVFVALAGVIALIVVAAWLMRRMGNLTGQRNEHLRVVAALSMGARERVVLMQVGEQQLLLGVAPGRVQKLHVLDEPLQSGDSSHPVAAFQDRLKKVMSRES